MNTRQNSNRRSSGMLRLAVAAGLTTAALLAADFTASAGERLVILHTNDTHSQIDPVGSNGLGGVLRRKAAIDSVRQAEKNVLLVDAGDAVQGSLFFYLYGGEVEQKVMNALGVELGILGNHEFDNGIDSLATILKMGNYQKLATNYFLEDSPLKGMFDPYTVKTYGGKRIGFMGLNLDPDGMISDGNARGVVYSDVIPSANLTAKYLKDIEKVDAVVAITHIGYNPENPPGDSLLAVSSKDIDIIIGGHSHTLIDPSTPTGARQSRMKNLDGEEVLVVQTGKSGSYLGKIEIDLDSLGLNGHKGYELIPLDSRFDSKKDPELAALIEEYRPGVDSLMHKPVGFTREALPKSSIKELNYMADFLFDRGTELADGIDFAIINKGGLRTDLPKGPISKGDILNLLPFRNKIVVIDVKGSDLLPAFDAMSRTMGNGVSRQVYAEYDTTTFKATKVLVDRKPIDPNKTYRVATIDYLAKGGDYLKTLRNGTLVAESPDWVYDDIIAYITRGKGRNKPFGNGPDKERMVLKSGR